MNILVSACLLGVACRYDGASKGLPEDTLRALMARHTLVPACPEQLGGLPTPRVPSERRGSCVVMRTGADVTDAYIRGAQQTLALAQRFGCTAALLKQRSPSCGKGEIYDGTFTGTVVEGWGVTAELLRREGIPVLGESRMGELLTEGEACLVKITRDPAKKL